MTQLTHEQQQQQQQQSMKLDDFIIQHPTVILFSCHFHHNDDDDNNNNNNNDNSELTWMTIQTKDGSKFDQYTVRVATTEEQEQIDNDDENDHIITVSSISQAMQKFDQYMYEHYIRDKNDYTLLLHNTEHELHSTSGLYHMAQSLGIRLAAHYESFIDLKPILFLSSSSSNADNIDNVDENDDENTKFSQRKTRDKCHRMRQVFSQRHIDSLQQSQMKIKNFKLSIESPEWTGRIASTTKPISTPVIRLRGLPWTCNEQDIAEFFGGRRLASKSLNPKFVFPPTHHHHHQHQHRQYHRQQYHQYEEQYENEQYEQEQYEQQHGEQEEEQEQQQIDEEQETKISTSTAEASIDDHKDNGSMMNGEATEEQQQHHNDNDQLSSMTNISDEIQQEQEQTEEQEQEQQYDNETKPQEQQQEQLIEAIDVNDANILLVLNTYGRATGEAYVEFVSSHEAKLAFDRDRATMKHRYIEIFTSTRLEMEQVRFDIEQNLGALGDSTVVRMRGLPYKANTSHIEQFFDGLEIATFMRRVKHQNQQNQHQNQQQAQQQFVAQKKILIVIGQDGKSTGDAYVEFASVDELKEALKRNKEKIFNRYIELFRSTTSEMHAARLYSKQFSASQHQHQQHQHNRHHNHHNHHNHYNGQQHHMYNQQQQQQHVEPQEQLHHQAAVVEQQHQEHVHSRSSPPQYHHNHHYDGATTSSSGVVVPGVEEHHQHQHQQQQEAEQEEEVAASTPYVVRLTNLSVQCDEKYIAELFSMLSIEIVPQGIRLVVDENHVSTGEAFVVLSSEHDVNVAVESLSETLRADGAHVMRSSAEELNMSAMSSYDEDPYEHQHAHEMTTESVLGNISDEESSSSAIKSSDHLLQMQQQQLQQVAGVHAMLNGNLLSMSGGEAPQSTHMIPSPHYGSDVNHQQQRHHYYNNNHQHHHHQQHRYSHHQHNHHNTHHHQHHPKQQFHYSSYHQRSNHHHHHNHYQNNNNNDYNNGYNNYGYYNRPYNQHHHHQHQQHTPNYIPQYSQQHASNYHQQPAMDYGTVDTSQNYGTLPQQQQQHYHNYGRPRRGQSYRGGQRPTRNHYQHHYGNNNGYYQNGDSAPLYDAATATNDVEYHHSEQDTVVDHQEQ